MFNAETVETNYFIEGVKAYLSYIHERYRNMSLRRYGFFLCIHFLSLSVLFYLFLFMCRNIFPFSGVLFHMLLFLCTYFLSLYVLFYFFLFFFLKIRYHFIIKVCQTVVPKCFACVISKLYISSFLLNSKQNSLAFFPPRFIPFRPVR